MLISAFMFLNILCDVHQCFRVGTILEFFHFPPPPFPPCFYIHFLLSLQFYIFSFTPVEMRLSSGEGRLRFRFTVPMTLSECPSHTGALIYREQWNQIQDIWWKALIPDIISPKDKVWMSPMWCKTKQSKYSWNILVRLFCFGAFLSST